MVENGSLIIIMSDRDRLEVCGAQINAAFSSDPVPSGMGTMICQTIKLPKKVQLTQAKVDFLWRKDSIVIPRVTTRLWGGLVEGKFKADQNRNEMPFEIWLSAENLAMSDLMRSLGSGGASAQGGEMLGQLQAQARFQGSLLRPETASGQGQVRVQNARLVNYQGLVLLGGLLNRPDFQNLPLQKCDLDFVLQSGQLQIPRFEARSSDIQLTGEGWIRPFEETQEFKFKLAIRNDLAAKVPKEALEGLDRRADGYIEVPFRLWGSLSRPQTDLAERFSALAAQAVGGAILDKIFRAVPAK